MTIIALVMSKVNPYQTLAVLELFVLLDITVKQVSPSQVFALQVPSVIHQEREIRLKLALPVLQVTIVPKMFLVLFVLVEHIVQQDQLTCVILLSIQLARQKLNLLILVTSQKMVILNRLSVNQELGRQRQEVIAVINVQREAIVTNFKWPL